MRITICGSIAFYTELEKVRDELVLSGHEVLIPELDTETPPEFGSDKKLNFGTYIEDRGGIDTFDTNHEIWNIKHDAITDHFKKIEWAEAILVANYDKRGIKGYIGGNTLMEMGLAFFLKKKIYMLYPVSSDLSYKVEILGMRPQIIDGNLSLIT